MEQRPCSLLSQEQAWHRTAAHVPNRLLPECTARLRRGRGLRWHPSDLLAWLWARLHQKGQLASPDDAFREQRLILPTIGHLPKVWLITEQMRKSELRSTKESQCHPEFMAVIPPPNPKPSTAQRTLISEEQSTNHVVY